MNKICRICGNSEANREFIAREMQFGTREEFCYLQCSSCKCLQIADIPDDISKFYPDDYYTNKALEEDKYLGIKGCIRTLPFKASIWPNFPFNWIVSKVVSDEHFMCLRDLNIDYSKKILDVGCGNGKHFIYPLKIMGFKYIAGCDPFIHSSIDYSNGLSIYKKTLSEFLDITEYLWDIITFHHSFEHIDNPLETLKDAASLLDDNGLCIIRIPTSSSFAWEYYGTNWVQLDAPRHLFLHSVESIKLLAKSAGFEVISFYYDSKYLQFWNSENYIKDIPLKDQKKGKGIDWFFKRRNMNKRAAKLNLDKRGDQAVFILKKL